MDKFDRILSLHRIFNNHRRGLSLAQLSELLECSTKTVTRVIERMRDELNAPIEYIHAEHGYRYAGDEQDMFELPGLWLSAGELQSMVLLLGMLENLGNSLLARELKAVDQLLAKNLSARGLSAGDLAKRIKVLPLAHSEIDSNTFLRVGEALLGRRQLRLDYSDYAGKRSARTLSAQTLVYYRDNWYLDAWCHHRDALRIFALARIENAELLSEPAKEISGSQLADHFTAGYGIFAGSANKKAHLRFLPPVALEISRQRWHPEQQTRWQGKDYYLSFPYSDERELLRDILRHLPYVEVLKPASLRKAVQQRLQASLLLYKPT